MPRDQTKGSHQEIPYFPIWDQSLKCSLTLGLGNLTIALKGFRVQAVVQSSVVKSVRRALHTSGFQGLSTLDIEFDAGLVRLRGELHSYYLKQMAQELAKKVDGVNQVENAVEVY